MRASRNLGPEPGGHGASTRSWWALGLPLLTTPALTAVIGTATRQLAHLPNGRLLPPGELALQLVLAYLLLAFARRLSLFVASQVTLVAAFHAAQALKVTYMAGPIRPDDLVALPELVRVLHGASLLALAAPVAVLAALVLANLAWRPRAAFLAAVGGSAMVAVMLLHPAWIVRLAEGGRPAVVWNQGATMLAEGPTGYLLGETARNRASRPPLPTRAEVEAVLAQASPPGIPAPSATPRDVVLILLESFWDARQLSAAGLSRDPLSSGFRALWDAAGDSHAMSPEFGGGTANPELELLCGTPTRLVFPGIAFATSVRHALPCLPELLAEAGWTTAAFHPNVPGFWNRAAVYPRLGFQRFHSLRDFTLDDRNGEFLSDASLYRQAWAMSHPRPGAPPELSYILTYTGHWNYPLNPKLRPYVVTATSEVPEVARYASSTLYSSRELVTFIDQVITDDPDALIVALGDHLPVLGKRVGAYRESHLFSEWVAGFTPQQLRTLTSVPLLMIDGRKGPVPLGTVSQFELPSLILERLGLPVPPWMAAMLPPEGWHIRTHPDGMLVLPPGGDPAFCHTREEGPVCEQAFGWLDRARIVARDVVLGREWALASRATMAP